MSFLHVNDFERDRNICDLVGHWQQEGQNEWVGTLMDSHTDSDHQQDIIISSARYQSFIFKDQRVFIILVRKCKSFF